MFAVYPKASRTPYVPYRSILPSDWAPSPKLMSYHFLFGRENPLSSTCAA